MKRILKLNQIKDLDIFCRLSNYSIKYNRKRRLCGFNKMDYRVKE